jgi:hypothetical protein
MKNDISTSSSGNSFCPYCGDLLSADPDGTDRDHIFVSGFGRTTTSWIISHRRCNSRFGYDVEGSLQKQGTLLSLLLHVSGSGRQPIKGSLGDTGHVVEYDVSTGSLRSRKPVYQNGYNYLIAGTPKEFEDAAKRMGVPEDVRRDALRQAYVMDLTKGFQIVSKLKHDWKLVYRLVAKVALGAGGKAFGDHFIESSFASTLRDAMWSDQFATSVGRLTEFSLLDRMEDYFNRHASPVKRLTPPQEARRVVLVPLAARTAIFVFFGITIPGLRGFVVPELPLSAKAGQLSSMTPREVLFPG